MANLRNEICDEVAQMCQDKHIKDIMGFQHDWNKELIAQFYAQSTLDMIHRMITRGPFTG